MKKIILVILLTVSLFTLSTWLTNNEDLSADHYLQIGFPLTYFDAFQGKWDKSYDGLGFKPFHFLIDLMVHFVLAIVIVFTLNRFKLGKSKST